MTVEAAKLCRKCGQTKPRTEFYPRRDRNSVMSHCKECSKAATIKGYAEWRVENPRKTPEQRFLALVEKTDGCWNWKGTIQHVGYGMFRFRGRTGLAHRASYIMAKGEIPKGLVLDHLCRNRACVRPDHLEAVTQKENIDRGFAPTSKRRRTS